MSKMMFDLETMSTNPNAAIASIGAVIFDEKLGITDRFYTNVSLKSCKDVGLHFSDDTIQWWKQQKPEVMATLMVDPVPVSEAILGLFDFYKSHKCVEVFSWGANFDFPVISSAAFACGLGKEPWKYYNVRCARTLAALFGMKIERNEDLHHNAMQDAEDQAQVIIKLYKELSDAS